MFGCPIIFGGAAVKSLAVAYSPSLQVSDGALPGGDLTPGDEKRGYIFLPLGNYGAIEVPVEDTGTRGIETIVQPWDSAADLASTTVLKQAFNRMTALRHSVPKVGYSLRSLPEIRAYRPNLHLLRH